MAARMSKPDELTAPNSFSAFTSASSISLPSARRSIPYSAGYPRFVRSPAQ
jgi:hypothetical protein